MKIIGVSGHRSGPRMGGYDLPNPTYNYVCSEVEKFLLEENPDKVITGGSIGFDQWCSFICYKLHIPYIFAVPFIGQETKWPAKSQKIYKRLLDKAEEVVIVSEGEYAPAKLHKRNEFIVDYSDKMLFCYDGSAGGTGSCFKYACKVEKEHYIIDPNAHKKISL